MGYVNGSAIDSEGNLYTWGHNAYGQLGDGTLTVEKHSPIETLLTIDYNVAKEETNKNYKFNIDVQNANSATKIAYKIEGDSDFKYVSIVDKTAIVIVPKTTKAKEIHFELGVNINGKDSIVNNVNNKMTLSLKANTPPVITAENKKLKVGDKFNPLDGVTANDKEDGNITKDIKVIENTVDTSKAGTYTVKYEVTDSQGGKVTKSITVTVEAVAQENEATSKLAYFKSYGIILEGETLGNENYDNTVRKALVIKDKDGTVKLKKDIVNTNWYNNGYSGFQSVLTTKDISDIGSIENAKVEIEVNYKGTVTNYDFKTAKPSGGGGGGKVVPTPPNVPPAIKPGTDLGWQSKYYYIQDLPKIEYGNSVIQFIVKKDRNIVLTNTLNDSGFNIRSYYKTNADQYVLDVVVKVKDFNMSDSQNNVFEVKNKAGQVVHTGKVATFADGVFEGAAPKSALQVIVPKEYSNDDYSVDIVIKDKSNVEKARFTAPKFS
nr:immunoglobulin-like domain-containing protein [Clostridium sardiniense]